MKLSYEKSTPGHGTVILPPCDVPVCSLPASLLRETPPMLPELAETEVSRHYTELAKRAFGVNNGFYPLGSCTMKYNPRINEEMASLPGFASIHPLQPKDTARGCEEVYTLARKYLCEITGMDDMTFQPAAGAHGEFIGLLLIKAYHESRGEGHRNKIIIPDSAHGTNPASAAVAGYKVVSIPSSSNGCVDLAALRAAIDENTAGLMLTNPNTLGIFDTNILEITDAIHQAGGLVYYDGANLNAIMGKTRPGDMGFDVIHLNLHKTFSTPHGGGGPGSGPVGCKALLAPFLPESAVAKGSMPKMQAKGFYGHFLVVLRALTYIATLGSDGITEASETAVLNANYMMNRLGKVFDIPFIEGYCMHEFVLSLDGLKTKTGVSALDVAKSLIDRGIHPPTMYFPLIVKEALMLEPTETESKATLDEACDALIALFEEAQVNSEYMHNAPHMAAISRPDEVEAARNPIIRYTR